MSEQTETPAVAEPTGDARVDAAVASLDGLEARPVGEHVAVFEAAHALLREALSGAEPDDTRGPA